MAGSPYQNDEEIISGINVTPLVDIMMVLLVIFIVTASFILRSTIPVQLPRAQTAEESNAGLLALTVDKDGQLYVNGKPGKLDDIPTAVAEARERLTRQGTDVSAIVSADVDAPYGLFAEVVDRLRLESVTEIALDTKPVALEENGQ